MPNAVSDTQPNPKFHATLFDGTTRLGLNFVNGRGDIDPQALNRFPIPRTATRIAQGRQSYDDQVPPYDTRVQSSWAGGRASLTFDDDATRFLDSYRANTQHENQVILGPLETWTRGMFGTDGSLGSLTEDRAKTVRFQALTGSQQYLAQRFTASSGYSVNEALINVRRVGTPTGNLTVEIWDESASEPNAIIAGAQFTKDTSDITDTVSEWIKGTPGTPPLLTNTVNYYLVVYDDGSPTTANHWEVGVDYTSVTNAHQSTDGLTWSSASVAPYFRVIGASKTSASYRLKFFEYKGMLYAVQRPPDGTAGDLWMMGYRGVADSNSGALGRLNDSTQTGWATAGNVSGGFVKIIKGPGSNETQPWRNITGSGSGFIDVSPDWIEEHTTDTEYVVITPQLWQQVTGDSFTVAVTDVAVDDEFVYFARGDWNGTSSTGIRRYRWWNNGGTAQNDWATETEAARFVEGIRHPTLGHVLWGGLNNHPFYGVSVMRGEIPPVGPSTHIASGAGNLNQRNTFALTNDHWVNIGPSNITLDMGAGATKAVIGSGFTTGDFLEKKFSTPLDLTAGDQFAFLAYSDTVPTTSSSGDLSLYLEDVSGSRHEIILPPLVASNWLWCELEWQPLGGATTSTSGGSVDATAITKIGFEVNTNHGTSDAIFQLVQGIHLQKTPHPFIKIGGTESLINGLESWGDQRQNLFVFKEDSIWEVQSENGDIPVPLPLKELAGLRSTTLGQASTTNDVYLYFSAGQHVERYFNSSLEDVGPTRDEGLPDGRQGDVVAMESLPEGVVIAVDGGTSGYSSVLIRRGGGWHEIYRAPKGARIYDVYSFATPGPSPDRLFVNVDNDVIWLAMSPAGNPRYDALAVFTHESAFVTGWYYFGLRDVQKLFSTLKLFSEGLNGADETGGDRILVDYMVDSGDHLTAADWTELSTVFQTSPTQAVAITSDGAATLDETNGVTGKRIRFRFRLMSDNFQSTPVLTNSVLDALTTLPVKFGWEFSAYVEDFPTDLLGDKDYTTRAETVMNTLDTWFNTPTTPLLFNDLYSIDGAASGKMVIIQPTPSTPVMVDPADQKESHRVTLTLMEI